ncbi:MAG: 50S ribosomal protein L25 [Betaproteobacteria bacterium HGW-Betaproteobacteria-13]|jgi:large subunit ribosomal protein L25|uniref:Large ribosomal subunit protein bL25 n=1 Tax=Parazoarcus communis TaxID=41977 RepID=A0A2U8GZB0_9RHOO|nr:50S ribosomal protein L25/general stress protein Ctc [Parazoarcus communis]AWI78286.1 50S ribosomal protein L25/general stress protein Ctc [Parazoarcus communis]PKO57277.1 MAG: 50S ribosomal protein L25 [Betaproteobacteria bacterium HGW-Betaproteobacteria-19]PKO80332.1 MAG: 50S ribosomal protein L25 [Betaproteobacteria bacterium HGW-Betaproteobacteria-13]
MQIEFKAVKRELQGSSASRRLRREGQLPGIVYGGEAAAQPILMDHNELFHLLKKEAFHASVLSINIDGAKETVLLRDTQWHAYKPQVMHIDFQRVKAGETIHLKVPLHFINGDECPAVKTGGCIVAHVLTELDVECLPSNLPEFITVDLAALEPGDSIHVSQIVLPEGVSTVHHGEGDPVVASAQTPRGSVSAQAEGEEGEEAAE